MRRTSVEDTYNRDTVADFRETVVGIRRTALRRGENLGARDRPTDRESRRDDRLRINISRVAGAVRNITLGTRAHAE